MGQSQIGDHVAHFGSLQQRAVGAHVVGDPGGAQRQGQRFSLGIGPHQHRHLAGVSDLAALQQTADLGGHEASLGHLVVGGVQPRRQAGRVGRPAVGPGAKRGGDGVAQGYQVASRAEVLVEDHRAGVGVLPAELGQIARLGSRKRVQALIGIAHDQQVVVPRHDLAQQPVLQTRGVLELIDQHPAVGVLEQLQGRRVTAEQARRGRQHGREVDCPPLLKQAVVGLAQRPEQVRIEAAHRFQLS